MADKSYEEAKAPEKGFEDTVRDNFKDVAINRMFACVVTKGDAMPGTSECTEAYWVVQGSAEKGGVDLQEVGDNFVVPGNAIVAVTLEQAISLLRAVKAKIMPDMSMSSGIVESIVHTEAVYNMETGVIETRLMSFAGRFMALRAFEPIRKSGYANVKVMPPLKDKTDEGLPEKEGSDKDADEALSETREV